MKKELTEAGSGSVMVLDTDAQTYGMPNCVLSSIYNSNLMEEQIQHLAFYKALNGAYEDLGENNGLLVHVPVREYRKKFRPERKGKSIYDELRSVAEMMNSKQILLEDPQKHCFIVESMMPQIRYENGTLHIKFGELTRRLILARKNFTILDIDRIAKLKSAEAIRLYSILRSQAYSRTGEADVYVINMSFPELQLVTGVVTVNDRCRVILRKNKKDYERAVQATGEKKYNEWKEFRRRILDPAVKDMNASTEILVEYTAPKRVKDKTITFRVRYKAENTELPGEEMEKELSEQEKSRIVLVISRIIEEPLSYENLSAVAEAAGYDTELVAEKYKMVGKGKKPENMTGWMIAACRNDYKEFKESQEEEQQARSGNTCMTEKKEEQKISEEEYALKMTDATFFDYEEDLPDMVLDSVMDSVCENRGIPYQAVQDPLRIKQIVQALSGWNDRAVLAEHLFSAEEQADRQLIVRETYRLALRCMVEMICTRQAVQLGNRYINGRQIVERFNRRISMDGRYEANFTAVTEMCIRKYCRMAEKEEICRKEKYMYAIILDTLEISQLEWESYFERTYPSES